MSFFLLLSVAVFLGDGLQPAVDVVGALGVCVLLWLSKSKRSIVGAPPSIRRAWVLVGVVAAISTALSSSVGLSVFWWVRFVSAYAAFEVFYRVSSSAARQQFIKGVFVLTIIAAFGALAAWMVPPFREVLPSMNLLFPTFGHNHLATLLVFVFPLVITTSPAIVTIATLLLVATVARGAWILVGAFALMKARAWVAAALAGVLIGFFLLSVAGDAAPSPLSRYLVKPLPTASRIAYAQQAWEGIREFPVFGSGPGTFSLVSLRHQGAAGEFSWFAHNFFLQAGAELGLVGAVSWAVLLWILALHIFHNLRQPKKVDGAARALLWGAVLLFVYAQYEFVLDFWVVWMLWWATLGLLVGASRQSEEKTKPPTGGIMSAALLLFAASWALGHTFQFWGDAARAFWLSAYDRKIAREAALTLAQDSMAHAAINALYRKDPTVLASWARSTGSQTLFLRAAREDPHNYVLQKDALVSLATQPEDARISTHMRFLCEQTSSEPSSCARLALVPPGSFVRQLPVLLDAPSFPEGLQKMLYLTGLDLVSGTPEVTRDLWEAARGILPNWGYYHVELASLEHWVFRNPDRAMGALGECANIVYTAPWCSELKEDVDTLPAVGAQEAHIRAIPTILSQ